MIDSRDAPLLHPVRPDSTFVLERAEHRLPIVSELFRGIVLVTIHSLPAPAHNDLLSFFERVIVPILSEAGARILGLFATEHSPNNFPRLPLREGENVDISYLGIGDLYAYHDHRTALGLLYAVAPATIPTWCDGFKRGRRFVSRPDVALSTSSMTPDG